MLRNRLGKLERNHQPAGQWKTKVVIYDATDPDDLERKRTEVTAEATAKGWTSDSNTALAVFIPDNSRDTRKK